MEDMGEEQSQQEERQMPDAEKGSQRGVFREQREGQCLRNVVDEKEREEAEVREICGAHKL